MVRVVAGLNVGASRTVPQSTDSGAPVRPGRKPGPLCRGNAGATSAYPHPRQGVEKAAGLTSRGAHHGRRLPHVVDQAMTLPSAHRQTRLVGIDEGQGSAFVCRMRVRLAAAEQGGGLNQHRPRIESPRIGSDVHRQWRAQMGSGAVGGYDRAGDRLQHPLGHERNGHADGRLRIPSLMPASKTRPPGQRRVRSGSLVLNHGSDIHKVGVARGYLPEHTDRHQQWRPLRGRGAQPAFPAAASSLSWAWLFLARSTLRCNAASRSTTSPVSVSSSALAAGIVSPPSILAATNASTASL